MLIILGSKIVSRVLTAGSVFLRVWDALEIEKVVFYFCKTHIFTNPHLLILGVILELFGSVL